MYSKKETVKVLLYDLKPHPKNPKKHNDALIEKSISELGYAENIVIDENNVILAGHGRVEAIKKTGGVEAGGMEIEAVRITGWTEEEKEKYLLLSNQSTILGGFDNAILKDFGNDVLVYSGFDRIIEPDEKDDEIPENAPTVAKLGDLWALGRHRLMCGDSTKIEDVEKLMNGQKADMVFTDPPYELQTQGGGVFQNSRQMNEVRDNGVDSFDPSVLIPLAKTSVFFHNKPLIKKYCQLAEEWEVSYDLAIYKKQGLPNWKGHLMTDVEYIAILGELDPNKGLEMEMYSKVYEGRKDADNELSYSKPVELCSKFIQLYSTNSVLDLFGGSGSTLIACEQTNRICYMMELDEKYVDVIIKRWEDYTGQNAKKLT